MEEVKQLSQGHRASWWEWYSLNLDPLSLDPGHQVIGSQNVVPGLEILVLPGKLLEIQIQSQESATVEVELSNLYFSKPSIISLIL